MGFKKVAFVKDNFSSALLHYKSTSEKAGSAFIAELLKEAFEKFNLFENKQDIHILSDGGSENKGDVLSWVKNTCAERSRSVVAPPIVKKLTAMTDDCLFSNAMSESTHKIYKTDFMNGEISEDIASHLQSLENFMDYFGNQRYPCRLYGKTPNEILSGQIIDKHIFTETLKQAKVDRAEANRKFNQCLSKLGCKAS